MDQSLHTLAHEKASRLLGQAQAERLIRAVLREIGLETITTPDELMQIANLLRQREDTFEVALGAILGFQATVHGSMLSDGSDHSHEHSAS